MKIAILWRAFGKTLAGSPGIAAMAALMLASAKAPATTVTTLSGGPNANNANYYGYADGDTATIAQFDFPSGLALDPSGTSLFVADYTNNAVRWISSVNTGVGDTYTYAGPDLGISRPVAVAMDGSTNLYVLNQGNGINGNVLEFNASLFMQFPEPGAQIFISTNAVHLTNAVAMALDGLTNLYVVCKSNTVLRITPSGASSVVGIITNAGVNLRGVTVTDNSQLALTDAGNNGIWMLNPITGVATKFTGFHGAGDTNGPPFLSAFNHPENIAKADGGWLVVADRYNHKVKTIDASGNVYRLFGVNPSLWVTGSGTYPGWWDGTVDPIEEMGSEESREPLGIVVAPDGSIFDTEVYYHLIRHATDTGLSNTNGVATAAPSLFNQPDGIALDATGANLFIADKSNNIVEELNLGSNQTTNYLTSSDGINQPSDVAIDSGNDLYVLNQGAGGNGSILEFDSFRNLLATNAVGLSKPTAMALDGYGNIFVAEQGGEVWAIGTGISNVIATITNLNVDLEGIAIFNNGSIAVSDAGNHVIWQINPITKAVSLLSGQLDLPGNTLGSAAFSKFNSPRKLARAGGDELVVADSGNNRLVVMDDSGAVTNALNSTNSLVWFGRAGDPVSPGNSRFVSMNSPVGVAIGSGGVVYDTEALYNDVRGLQGTGLTQPASGPFDVLPYFNQPSGIALDTGNANLFIADKSNNVVEELNLGSNQTTNYLGAAQGISYPSDVAVDTNNNLYVLNQGTGGNGSILEFDPFRNLLATNVVGLNKPTAMALDSSGDIFVAEENGAVQEYIAGVSNTFAVVTHTGVQLEGIAIFDDGTIIVSDAGNHVVWQINKTTKAVSLLTGQLGLAGNTLGSAGFARLDSPHKMVRAAGNLTVIADSGNNRLVVMDRSGAVTNALISTNSIVWFGQAGDPVGADNARFVSMNTPVGVALGTAGAVFSSETFYGNVREISNSGLSQVGTIITPPPLFNQPEGIAVDAGNANLFIADKSNNVVEELNLGSNQTTNYLTSADGINQPSDVAIDSGNDLYVLNQGTGGNGSILEFDPFRNLLATNAVGLNKPTAMALDSSGDIFVAEANGVVQEYIAGVSNTFAVVTNIGVQLEGIAIFDDGTIIVSDAGNHVVWQIDPITKAISLLSGQVGVSGNTMGSAAFAKFNSPHKIVRADGDLVLVADSGNNRLVVMDRSGAVTNALISTNSLVWFGRTGDPVGAGDSRFVPMTTPVGVALGAAGAVFSSETFYNDIREIADSGLFLPGSGNGSGGGSGTNIVIAAPIISPNSGYYPMGQIITVQSPNPNVYYTTDGSEPTTNSASVAMAGNVGFIHWFSTTNDLTGLHVKSFVGTNASVTVTGQPVAASNIGTPPDFNPSIQAGIGSSIVVPVVCNLQTNQQVESFQFRYEVAPLNNAHTPVILPLGIGTNDFIPLPTAAQGNAAGGYLVSSYSLGITNGLEVIGSSNIFFQHFAVVALVEVQIPKAAAVGDTYSLNVLFPSSTSDGFDQEVLLTPMAQTTITATNIPYVVGDSASSSGTWYNAGTFGDDNLDNSDVNQVAFASTGLRVPFNFSDVFNAMDSYPLDVAGAPGGDKQIRYLDWQTVLQRSLRLDTNDWSREWSVGGNLINTRTNLVVLNSLHISKNSVATWPWYRQALVGGISVGNAAPGGVVNMPVYVKLENGSNLGGLQFRALITPVDNAPPVLDAPQLNVAAGVASPSLQKSFKAGETAFGWSLLPSPSLNYSSGSSNFLGWVSFTIPPTAQSGQTYLVSFENADGAPDIDTEYDFESRSAYVSVNASAPPASICSDEWKIYFFGSMTNPLAADMIDADGDGVPNWMEYLAGTDPTNPDSKLQFTGAGKQVVAGNFQMQVQWLTAPGKAYQVQWTTNLAGAWTTFETISGDGNVINCLDTNTISGARYYRLHLLP